MLGFSKEDVKYLMSELEIDEKNQEQLMPIIRTNYDGYVFSNMIKENIEEHKMYNPNMTLYFLSRYIEQKEVPQELVDINIISDYSKIEGFMDLCKNMNKIGILEKIVLGEPVESELTEKFNAEIEFGEKELISLLYYLGYLTIKENEFGILKFGSPNDVIKKIYSEYFLEYIRRRAEINEELEVGGKYSDILLIPREKMQERYGVLIEFKYIKKEDYEKDNNLLKEKQKEAREQLEKYKKTEEIKIIPKLRSYSVVAIKDELYVEKI